MEDLGEKKLNLAKSSIGTSDHFISIQISHSIAQIDLFENQIKELDESIKSIMLDMDLIIMSFPGIGYIDVAMILGEIGIISRFSETSKLLVFAGL